MKDKKNGKFNIYRIIFGTWLIASITIVIVSIVLAFFNDGYVNVPLLLTGIISLFGGAFIYSVFLIVYLFVKANKYNKYLEENNIDERAEEQVFKEYINTTRHNRYAVIFRSISMWLRTVKRTPKKASNIVFSIGFVVVFVGCIIAFIIFTGLGNTFWALLSWGIGAGVFFIVLFSHLIYVKLSTSTKNIDTTAPSQPATVTACTLSSESYMSSGSHYATNTTRILGTTYLLYLNINGEQKRAYSKKYYNAGETVYVYLNKKLKDIVIFDESRTTTPVVESIKIRQYEIYDCMKISKLFYETVHNINAKDYNEKQLNAWANTPDSLWEKYDELKIQNTLVAEKDKKIVGFGSIDKSGYLDLLYVDKDFQRTGIATALCNELEKGYAQITVHSSITAKPFFEKRGYTVVNEQEVERGGVKLKNFEMRKITEN